MSWQWSPDVITRGGVVAIALTLGHSLSDLSTHRLHAHVTRRYTTLANQPHWSSHVVLMPKIRQALVEFESVSSAQACVAEAKVPLVTARCHRNRRSLTRVWVLVWWSLHRCSKTEFSCAIGLYSSTLARVRWVLSREACTQAKECVLLGLC